MTSEDGYGNVEGDWGPLAGPVAAEIMPIRGDEEVLAQRLTGVTLFEIRVRGSTATRGVQTGDRVVDDRSGQSYDIRAIVNPDQRGAMLAMTCSAGGADG